MYSFGKYYRKYGYYPSFFPLLAYSDHSGPQFCDHPEKHEIENDAKIYLTFRKERKEILTTLTNKNVYTIISPQIFYRRSNKIRQSYHAKGTIFFPMHSLPDHKIDYDINEYCKRILSLDSKYKPFKICLHYHDINRGVDAIYKKNGLEVVSAGDTSSDYFIKNLYGILRNAKYTSSNEVGTISFLSIEMGIRFFLFPKIKIDHSIERNKENVRSKLYNQLRAELIFENSDKVISSDLKFLVEKNLGIYDSIGRLKFSYILWKRLIYEIITFKLINKIFYKLKKAE